MADSNKNYTPISIDGAHSKGSFFGPFKSKSALVIGGLVAMVVLVGVGAVALRNVQTLTTPAQTIGPSCPAGYKQVGVGTPSVVDMNALCPGGDIIVVSGPTGGTTPRINTTANSDGGAGTGDTGSTGPGGGGGDIIKITPPIICCKLPEITPQETPTPSPEFTPHIPIPVVTKPQNDIPNDTPNSCVIPKLEIIDVKLDCPNCEAK
jgi:hypothetical protein